MNFQENGFLAPGKTNIDIDDLFRSLVIDNFYIPSQRRGTLFSSFITFVKELNDFDITDGVSYLIIDGSFCSQKMNPGDMDVFLYYDAASQKRTALEKYIDLNKRTHKNNGIHIMTFTDFSGLDQVEIDQNKRRLDDLTRAQFERYYSYTRNNEEKGYLCVLKESLSFRGDENDFSTTA